MIHWTEPQLNLRWTWVCCAVILRNFSLWLGDSFNCEMYAPKTTDKTENLLGNASILAHVSSLYGWVPPEYSWRYRYFKFCIRKYKPTRPHRKKKVRKFPVPSRDVTTKLSLGGNNDVINKLFLPRGSLVSDIPAGDGKLVNLFSRCRAFCCICM